MSVTLQARANAVGRRIDVTFRFERPSPTTPDVPALRLMRRRLGYPVGPDDGTTVMALEDVLALPGQPWAHLERLQGRTIKTGGPDGSLEAEVTLYFAAPPSGELAQARLAFFDVATQSFATDLVTECSRLVRTTSAAPGWQNHELLQLLRTPGGGPEVPGGALEIFSGNDVPTEPDRLVWTPPASPARVIECDVLSRWKIARTEATVLTFETRRLDTDPGMPWLSVKVDRNSDASTEAWAIEVHDGDLDPLTDYYYSLFNTSLPEPLVGHAVALATADYDSPRKLFLRLPGAYQRADEPDPTRPTGAPGALRRFLGPVGQTVDLARSMADGVRPRHDADVVRVELLPRLARMIGWWPDLAAPAEVQRRDVRLAPDLFGTVGTAPNALALVNRVTRWPCQVKEFVNNIFMTNAPESVRLWELFEIDHDGTAWSGVQQLTLTTDVDARPALVVDGSGVVWLFWESDRSGWRAVWCQRLDGMDSAPALARGGTADDSSEAVAVEESPTGAWDGSRVWLFWSSNREGQWDIWGRTFTGGPPGSDALRLTDHPAEDRSPAAVFVPGPPPRVWLFWSSRRRGPADIWARSLDVTSGTWNAPVRITTSPLVDDRPAATVDVTGRLWLFWVRDTGARQSLWYQTHDGTDWSAPDEVDMGHARDDAPTAVTWKDGVFVLWHSNHEGPWQIWGRWGKYDPVTGKADWLAATRLDPSVTGSKEPAAVIDADGDLRVVWRSQRRARWYRSRTIDTTDTELLEAMGTLDDCAHYTYDTGTADEDWYARGTVGLFLTPDVADPALIRQGLNRARGFLELLRPLPVRFVGVTDAPSHTEVLAPDLVAGEEWSEVVT